MAEPTNTVIHLDAHRKNTNNPTEALSFIERMRKTNNLLPSESGYVVEFLDTYVRVTRPNVHNKIEFHLYDQSGVESFESFVKDTIDAMKRSLT